MLSPEISKRIREIEIYTRRLVSGSLVGDSTSACKGVGLDFDQLRDYQMGDDVRFIDWHSSARADRLLVKQYIEDRNRTILLAVDCSASSFFGSQTLLKYEANARIAAILALIGSYGKDRVGLILFSDIIELYIPPKRGMMHTRYILEKLFTMQPRSKGTDFSKAFDHIIQLKQRNAMLFIISDFIGVRFEKNVSILNRLYEMILINMHDAYEKKLPYSGMLRVKDPETGAMHLINLHARNQKNMEQFYAKQINTFEYATLRFGIDAVQLQPESCIIGNLIRLFRRRMRY